MPEEKKTRFKELKTGRAFEFSFEGVKGFAVKLEGFQASRIGGVLNLQTVSIGAERERAEMDNWFVLMYDERLGGVTTAEGWARSFAEPLANVSGSNIGTVSFPLPPTETGK